LATVEVERGEATLDEADCALGFGAVTRTPCLTVRLDHGRAVTRWRWHDDAHPVPDRQLPARGQRAGKPHA
ncbi:MAG TPA: hypothetical protein VFZ93_15410, partial [Albitalea sp.]